MKLQDGEQLLKAEPGRIVRSKLSVRYGILSLTDRRLVFDRRNSIAASFGLLGALLDPILPRAVEADLPLSEIASFTRSKYGRNQNAVGLTMREGKEYRVIVSNFDAWAAALTQMNIPQAQPTVTE